MVSISVEYLEEGADIVVGGKKLLRLGLVPAVLDVLVEVPLQPQERLTDHVRFVRIILDTLYEDCVMKVGDLFKVAKDQLLVIANDARRGGVVDLLYIALDDRLQVFAKFLLRLHQLANHGPKIDNRATMTD